MNSNPEDKESLQTVPRDFTIPIISASDYTYERIQEEFYIPNLPFIITGVTQAWPAQHDWITYGPSLSSSEEDAGARKANVLKEDEHITVEKKKKRKMPNWDYLSRQYGEFEVSVLQCPLPSTSLEDEEGNQQEDARQEASYGSGETIEMKFNDVIELWKKGKGEGMYIKDWHLRREVRERVRSDGKSQKLDGTDNKDNENAVDDSVRTSTLKDDENSDYMNAQEGEEETFYTIPDIFKNDWMDNYYTNNTNDDFSFVYFGTGGTFTPLHRDVYTSYSWSANILGRKRWSFIPPSSIPYCRLNPSNTNSSLHPDIRPGKVDLVKYPEFIKAHVIQAVQNEGSAIYVPSNWYHCVENLSSPSSSSSSTTSQASTSASASAFAFAAEEQNNNQKKKNSVNTETNNDNNLNFVISINQNWCNEHNLIPMYQSMKESIQQTEEALSDVRGILLKRKATGQDLDVESEWEEEVQRVLELNVGWGWETFYSMIHYNLLHPPAPNHLRPPLSILKNALSVIFANYEIEKKERTRAKSYDGALEAALSIINT